MAERLSKKKQQLAEKRSFEGNCEILKTIFQPRALFSDIPESRKGLYLFYNPPNNSQLKANARRAFLRILWFFSCFSVWNCQPAFIYPSMASVKSLFFLIFLDQLKI